MSSIFTIKSVDLWWFDTNCRLVAECFVLVGHELDGTLQEVLRSENMADRNE